jgi:hypothetical protein
MFFRDFKGNYKQIKDLQSFLNNGFCTILISGDHSSGKTSIIDMLSSEDKYDILCVDNENLTEGIINNFINYRTISSFFDKNKRKKLLFFDDVDCININKNNLQFLINIKTKCYVIFTVLSTEKKKILSSLKKIIDKTIDLSNISFKDCVQIIFTRVKQVFNEDDIDFDKLVDIIKSQSCNINNIMMLIDDCKNINTVLSDKDKDLHETNIYSTTKKILVDKLNNKEIIDIYLRDYGIIFSMIHENMSQLQIDSKSLLNAYNVITYCDNLDKYNYIHCKWGINTDCLNYYRFKKLNDLLRNDENNSLNMKFTQQFTKLSTQSSLKKKLNDIENYFQNVLDYIQFQSKKINISELDKNEKDLIVRFKKDF